MIAPIGFDETEEQYIARLEAEIARQAASQGSAGGEAETSLQNPQTSPTEQEFLEDNIATVAWHLGRPGARMRVDNDMCGLAVDPGEVLKEVSRRLTAPAQAPISSDDLTDYVVDAALSEYWDLSPRGWSETQRVAMRKAILTALAVPSAHQNTPTTHHQQEK